MRLSEQFVSLPWAVPLLAPVTLPKAVVDEVRRGYGGSLPGWYPHVHGLPWLERTMRDLTAAPTCHLSPDLALVVGLVVTQDNSCRYCYGVSRALLQLLGHDEERVLAIERDLESADLPRRERALLGWARRFSRANPRPTATDRQALLEAGCTAAEVAETAYVAAAHGFANRVVTMLAIPPARGMEKHVDGVLTRLMRPVAGWSIRRAFRRKPVTPQPPGDDAAARCVAALGDSPGGPLIRRAVDGMRASTVLSTRSKLLVSAVIGRALGCHTTLSEALPLLPELGLDPADVDAILDNLASPKLDAREAQLVPFARETVRYQPYQLQARTRELAAGLTRDETLELIGVTALANAMARLSVLLDQC